MTNWLKYFFVCHKDLRMEVGLCSKQHTVMCMRNHSNTVKVKLHMYSDGNGLVKVTGVTGIICGTGVAGVTAVTGVTGVQTQ